MYVYNNYNKITNYILHIYELSNFDHVLGVVSQTRVFGGNRIHDPHANRQAHDPLDYQGTLFRDIQTQIFRKGIKNFIL